MKPIEYLAVCFLVFACIVCVYCELTADRCLPPTKLDVAARWSTVILVVWTCGYYTFLCVRSTRANRKNNSNIEHL